MKTEPQHIDRTERLWWRLFVSILMCIAIFFTACLAGCTSIKKAKYSSQRNVETATEQANKTEVDATTEETSKTQLDTREQLYEKEQETTRVESGIDTIFSTDTSTLHMQVIAGHDAHFESETHKVDALWNDSTGSFAITVVTKPQTVRLNTKRTETNTRQKTKSAAKETKLQDSMQHIGTLRGRGWNYAKEEKQEVHKETVKQKESSGLPWWIWLLPIAALVWYLVSYLNGKRPITAIINKIRKRRMK
jgi:hypothetical protein